jgi:hypothetical protein
VVSTAGRASLKVVVGLSHLALSFVSKLVDTVSAVKGAADLLISLNKTLEFNSKVSVLSDQNVAMVLQCVDFRLDVSVLRLESLVRESQVILLSLCTVKMSFGVAALTLKVKELSGQMVVTGTLLFKSLDKVALLGLFALERSLLLALLILKTCSFITRLAEI